MDPGSTSNPPPSTGGAYCGRCRLPLADPRDPVCPHCSLELTGAGRFQRISGSPPGVRSDFWWVEAA
ncbi:MAG: hypothetical protein R3F16_00890 [Myxococcota bacterium]